MARLDVNDLPPGEYRFIVQVNTQSGRIQLEAQKNFHVFQDPLDLRFRSYQAILEELQLITSREEMSRLKAVAEGERQQVLNDFWKEMDPTPGTIRNERMTEFYLRVAYVRRVYQQARHDQTLTDRAKVYIIYGEPQKVSAYQKGAFSPNIEIWDYPHAGVHVVFQDDSGMGHYRLVEPYSLFSE